MVQYLDARDFVCFTSMDKGMPLTRAYSQNAGQNCIGIERLIVHSSQYDELREIITRRTSELRVGSALSNPNDGFVPTVDVGAVISLDKITDLTRIIADSGIEPDIGGERYPHPYLENGTYFQPTVIGEVDPMSELAQQECESHLACS